MRYNKVIGKWLSLVERLLREQEVTSSNLVFPTMIRGKHEKRNNYTSLTTNLYRRFSYFNIRVPSFQKIKRRKLLLCQSKKSFLVRPFPTLNCLKSLLVRPCPNISRNAKNKGRKNYFFKKTSIGSMGCHSFM